MTTIKLKPYRLKYTATEIRRMEKNTIESNLVYSWLRDKYSKKNLCKYLEVRYSYLYPIFTHPYTHLTFEKLFKIMDLLPDRSPKEILLHVVPSPKAWYDMDDTDVEILRKQMQRKKLNK